MTSLLTPSQKVANALKRVEKALRNWQDDPDSPRSDVNKMLVIVADLRVWTQGHVEADFERRRNARRDAPPIVAEASEEYDARPGDEEEDNPPDEENGHKQRDRR